MNDFIEIYDNVLSKSFCDNLITQLDTSEHLTAGRTGGGIDTNIKISQDLSLNQHAEFQQPLQTVLQASTKAITAYIEKYLFTLIGAINITLKHPVSGEPTQLTVDNFEEIGRPNLLQLLQYLYRLAPINAQKYQKNVGNYRHWHSEVYPQLNGNYPLHRVLLILIYLNDVEEGGETDFYYQQKSIKPKAGSMIIAPCGFTHTHRGNIPRTNDKYVLTSWVMFNPAEQIYRG